MRFLGLEALLASKASLIYIPVRVEQMLTGERARGVGDIDGPEAPCAMAREGPHPRGHRVEDERRDERLRGVAPQVQVLVRRPGLHCLLHEHSGTHCQITFDFFFSKNTFFDTPPP